MSDLKMHTANLVAKNIEKLTALFPNCITETRNEQGEIIRGVDFDLLRQELSEVLVEGEQERYTLNWVGKKESILAANAPIAKTLRPCREESVNFDTTENLFIEGDNLDALKLLQENYLGKVKMIYIDPPYNTGKDFIYNDDFAENAEEFLIRSNQIDEDGNRLIANTESNGRFHSDWLSMMYSRLRLARNLLTDDGVIFISIDDHEQANLKRVCDEIFGGDNFVGQIAVINNPKGRSDQKNLATAHEYLLIFQKSDSVIFKGFKAEEHITKRYNKTDEQGLWREIDLRKTGDNDRAEDRPNMYYPFYWNEKENILSLERGEGNIEIFPMKNVQEQGCWRWGKDTAKNNLQNLFARYMPNKRQWSVFEKDYFDENNTIKSTTAWSFKDVNSERGTELFEKKLDFKKNIFQKPKPLGTIVRTLLLATNNNDLILDFFAGSGTTAHAVMQLNAEDNGNRKFICVQLPEKTDEKSEAFKAGYSTIAEISKERIRRAGLQILQNLGENKSLDVGFRVLKIDSSNMKDIYYQPEQYDKSMLDHMVSHIKEDRTAEDLLFQVMLDWGIELSLPIERKIIDGSEVYFVAGNTLVACFDKFTMNILDEIAKIKPLRVVSTELAIVHDQDKTNIKERFKQLSPDTEVRFL
ncbi:MAG: site-specific DNA-methyltransferase [Haemophilus parainfluenzae]|nr:site-specific DNA-methyltransferase [Haemophilus parainfluenzae]